MLNCPDALSASIGQKMLENITRLSKNEPTHFSFPSKNGDSNDGSRNLIIEPHKDGT